MAPQVMVREKDDGWYVLCGLYYVVCEQGRDFEQVLVLRKLFKAISEPFVHPYEWRSVEVYLDSLFHKFGGVPLDTQAAIIDALKSFIKEKCACNR